MLKFIILGLVMVFAMMSQADAWELDRIGVEGVIQDINREAWVKTHTSGKQYASLSISIQGQCVSNCVRPINGHEDAVQVSEVRTSLPDEFEARVLHVNGMKVGEGYGKK